MWSKTGVDPGRPLCRELSESLNPKQQGAPSLLVQGGAGRCWVPATEINTANNEKGQFMINGLDTQQPMNARVLSGSQVALGGR